MARQYDDERNPFAAPDSDLAPDQYSGDPAAMNYAGFLTRFAATFVDGIILNIIGFVLGIAVGAAFAVGSGGVVTEDLQRVLSIVSSILGLILGWLYAALQESSASGATVGKRLCGIRVVTLEGGRLSFGQATGRHFGKILSALILLIGFLMQPFTERKQALHDMMAGAVVVKG